MSWISQKYWSDEFENNIEKETLIEENEVENNLKATEETIKEHLEAKVENIDNIDNTDISSNINTIGENTSNLPIAVNNLKWYQKIKIKVIEFLNKIFRRNKSKEKQEGNVL